jgi:hypothetical protein
MTNKKMLKPIPTVMPPRTPAMLRPGLPSAGDTVL